MSVQRTIGVFTDAESVNGAPVIDGSTTAEVVENGACGGYWTLRCPCGELIETCTWAGIDCDACGREGWWDSYDCGEDYTDIPLPMWNKPKA